MNWWDWSIIVLLILDIGADWLLYRAQRTMTRELLEETRRRYDVTAAERGGRR